MSKLTKRLTAILLSGMLIIGPASGSVLAAEILEDTGNVVIEDVGAEDAAVEDVEAKEVEAETVSDMEASDSGTIEESIVDEGDASDDSATSFMEEDLEDDQEYLNTGEADQLVEDGAAVEEESEPALIETSDDPEASVSTDVLMEVVDAEDSEVDSDQAASAVEETEGSNVEENTAFDDYTMSEAEEEEAPEKDASTDEVGQQDEDNTDVIGEELEPALIESTDDEEEFITTEATMGVVADGTCGDNLTWTLDEEGTLTISGTGEISGSWWDDYEDTIIRVVIGNGVTSIGDGAFMGCNCLTSVTIPDSVTSIGGEAFVACSLTSVTIPDSVTSLGYYVFDGCSSLTTVSIGNSVTSIGEGTFRDCSSLTRVIIPDSVTSIGDSAFSECSSLTSVTIPDSVTSIGDFAFFTCSNLESVTILDSVTSLGYYVFDGCCSLATVTIGNSVTSIGEWAFRDCSSLTSLTIGNSVTSIEESAFEGCSSLTSVTIPDSVTSIGIWAFRDCSSLTSVTISNSVTSTGENAFEDCTSLTNLVIPEGVTCIDYGTFNGCTSLANVTIPTSVTEIYEKAFYGCSSLTDVYFAGTKEEWKSISIESENDPLLNATLHCAIEILSIDDASITGLNAMTYTGKAITQNPVVKLGDTTLQKDTDYTVSYKNNTNAGTATMTITGIGNYEGTTTATFKINKATQTITASNLSLTYPNSGTISASGNKGKLTYKSDKIAIATVGSTGKVTAKGAGTAKITITAAATDNYKSATKTITVTVAKGAQSITAKATASSIAVGKTTTISITGNNGTVSYKTSDTTVATVTKSTGKVTAKKVGKVTITATAAATDNYKAASKTVTIKVVPAATAKIVTSNLATGIKLTWKKVPGATGYKVYRGSTLYKTITSGDTVTYTDTKANTNGTKYTFKVYATASTGTGPMKSVVTYRIGRPVISSAGNTASGKMTIKWVKNAKATGYYIQYGLDKTFENDSKLVNITKNGTVSKVISGLTTGKTYYVRIRTYKTVDGKKIWSAWSVVKSCRIKFFGWKKIDGKWYYYASGVKQTGWQKVGSNWYYLNPSSGARMTGWQKIGNKKYYLNPSNGARVTGWKYLGKKWYYFESSGPMKTGWLNIDGKRFYLDPSSGAMALGLKRIDGNWYYFTIETYDMDTSTYKDEYSRDNTFMGYTLGEMMVDNTMKIGWTLYYFDANGAWSPYGDNLNVWYYDTNNARRKNSTLEWYAEGSNLHLKGTMTAANFMSLAEMKFHYFIDKRGDTPRFISYYKEEYPWPKCNNLILDEGMTELRWFGVGYGSGSGWTFYTDCSTISIPKSVTYIDDGLILLFQDQYNVIYGYRGTAAQTFAKKCGITFHALD